MKQATRRTFLKTGAGKPAAIRQLRACGRPNSLAPARSPVALSPWAPLFQAAKLLAFGAEPEKEPRVADTRPDL